MANGSAPYPIVALGRFIEAIRDSGYKDTAYALAELVDNAFEANATRVTITVSGSVEEPDRPSSIVVKDDGVGMPPAVLRLALQFAGSTRFDSRSGLGRYGMGLPGSSLAQARRVDVYTWSRPAAVWWSYLDVDEIAAGELADVPRPRRRMLHASYGKVDSPKGTVVVWSRCDRPTYRRRSTLCDRIRRTLGRLFRRQLSAGKSIVLDGQDVLPVDPLFLNGVDSLGSGKLYGPPLTYDIEIGEQARSARTSTVAVRFAELPVDNWHSYSNEQKDRLGITKKAGVSIVRAGREIDYGWFFMGSKRKENYDDWWRCEIEFDPMLDELFGVTHTKQGIHPTEKLTHILSPDMERIARELNKRVRRAFITAKQGATYSRQAEARDYLIEPPKRFNEGCLSPNHRVCGTAIRRSPSRSGPSGGLRYRIDHTIIEDVSFYVPSISPLEIVVMVNEEHPFYETVYGPLLTSADPLVRGFRKKLDLLLLAAARAESIVPDNGDRDFVRGLRESWSNVLMAFLS